MPKLLAVDILSTVTCNAGVRLARVPDILALSTVQSVDGDEPAQLRCTRQSRAYPYLVQGRILRVVYQGGTFREWVISRIEDGSGRDSGAVDVSCVPIRTLLSDCGLLADVGSGGVVDFDLGQTGLTPTEYLADEVVARLPGLGITWVDVGDVDPVQRLDLDYPDTTPWGLVEMVRDRTQSEAQLRPSGSTQYLLDLLEEIGSTADPVRMRTAKNLRATKRTRDRAEQTTTVVVLGEAADGDTAASTIAEAEWLITAVDGGTKRLTLADPNGGADPIIRDGQLDGLYAVKTAATFASIVVAHTYLATQQVEFSSVAGFTAGDLIQFRVTSGSNGQQMTELGAGDYVTTYGRKVSVLTRSDVRGHTNRVGNPFMSTWTGLTSVPADGWTATHSGGSLTVSQLTKAGDPDYVEYGDYSVKLEANIASVPFELTRASVVVRPRAEALLHSVSARVHLTGGADEATVILQVNTVGGATMIGQASLTNDGNPVPAGSYTLEIVGLDLTGYTEVEVEVRTTGVGGSPTVVIVDAVQITQTAAVQPFVEFTEANQLWQAGNALLLSAAEPIQYQLEIVDLERLDGETFAADTLALGGSVIIHDTDLNISPTGRLLRMTVDELRPAKTEIVIAVAPKLLTRSLA